MKDSKKLITGLIKKDSRATKKRQTILEFLLKNHSPLSYFDIKRMLNAKKIIVDKTTIYRFLNILKNQKIVNEIRFVDGIKRYEIKKNHHHHIICKKCDWVECVELDKDLKEQEKLIEKTKKFKILNHSLEFYGLCPACRQTHANVRRQKTKWSH